MEEEAKAAARRASVVYNVRKTRDRNSGNGCRPCDSTQRRSVSILAWGTAEPVRHMPQRGQSDAGTAWIQPGMRRGRDADRFQSSVEERGKMNCLQCGGKLTKKRRKERRNLDSLGYLGNDIKVIGAMNIFTNITSRNRAGSRDLVPDF